MYVCTVCTPRLWLMVVIILPFITTHNLTIRTVARYKIYDLIVDLLFGFDYANRGLIMIELNNDIVNCLTAQKPNSTSTIMSKV